MQNVHPIYRRGPQTSFLVCLLWVFAISSAHADRPYGFTALGSKAQIVLRWDDGINRDAVAYYVLHRTVESDSTVRVIRTTRTAYLDREVATGVSYCYALSVVDTSGREEMISSAVCARPTETVTFSEVTLEAGLDEVSGVRSLAFVDSDGDGRPEVYATLSDRGVLLRNLEGRAFSEGLSLEVGTYGRPAFGDWNDDGQPDLFSGGTVYRAHEGGVTPVLDVWAERGLPTMGAAFGDYDRDGRLDFYVVGDRANGLYRAEKEGAFEPVGAEAGLDDPGAGAAARFFDVDGDADVDLYVANENAPNVLYRNEGDGTFRDVTAWAGVGDGGHARDVALGDYDGDGAMDLYVANENAPNVLYRNEGDGTFRDVSGETGLADGPGGMRVCFVDCDNDGDEDLYLLTVSGASVLYRNDDGEAFADVTSSSGLPTSAVVDMAFADYDGDGDPDLVTADAEGKVHLYRNNGSPSHRITVRLVGIGSARSGTGARVRIGYGGTSQTRQAIGRELTFGLGELSLVDSVEVVWPSGIVQVLERIGGDRTLTVVEHVAEDSARTVPGNGLRVLAPNGGEIWKAGETHEVRWTLYSREAVTSILYYSADDDSEWVAVDAISGDDTVYVWQIPELRSDRARVKVAVVGPEGAYLGEDISDDIFSLQPETELAPAVRMVEFEHDFGAIPTEETTDWALVLSNGGEGNLIVLDASATHEAFALASPELPTVVGPEQTLAIMITFSPTLPGEVSGSLVLGTNDPETPEIFLVLLGRGLDGVPPEMPVALRTEPVGAGIELRWSPNFDDDLAGYIVYRGDDADFVPDSPDDALGTTTDTVYVDIDVPEGTARFYRISAIDLDGNESACSEVAVGVWNETEPPYLAEISPAPDADVPEDWRLKLRIRDEGAGVDSASVHVEVNGVLLPDSCVVRGADSNEYVVLYDPPDEAFGPNDTVRVKVTARDLAGVPNGMLEQLVFLLRDVEPEFRIRVSEPASPEVARDIYIMVEAEVMVEDEDVDPYSDFLVRLFYRRAGEAVYDSSEMVLAGDFYEGVVPFEFVTSRGLEYYIVAWDGRHRGTYPPTESGEALALRAYVPNEQTTGEVVPGVGSEEKGYRMFSVPLALEDPSPVSVLEDDLGPMLAENWKAMRYNALEDIYEEHPSFGDIEPGQAFWLLTEDERDPLDVGSGYSVPTDSAYRLLLDPGWNQVGLPFNFWINWADIVRESGEPPVEAPWRYEGGLVHDVQVLSPWEGYWVRNLADEPVVLRIPPRQTQQIEFERTVRRWDEGEWGMRISAHCGDAHDVDNLIGVLRGASEAWDLYDVSEPPPVGRFVSLYLPHEDWGLHPGRYAMDFRPADEAIHTWRLGVRSTAGSGEITLEFESMGVLPEEMELRLVDMTSGEAMALTNQTIYRFELELGETQRELAVFSGPPGYVEAAEQESRESPRRYFLSQNFPNPFNGSTTITYAVPMREDGQGAYIHLGVYNMLGQEIRCLVDEMVSPGFYSVEWDGTDLHGKFAGAGIYFYKLVAEDFELMKRMIYLK